MILFAAIVPPQSALEAIEDTVRQHLVEPSALRPMHDMSLPIARFGNTSATDADRLIRVLTTAADEWSGMSLGLRGATVVDTPSERILGVQVSGDVDALLRLSLDVKRAAEQLRFLLDRRDFNPVLAVASVRPGTHSGLDAAAAALADFESEPWQVTEVSMRKQAYGHVGASDEVACVALPPG